MFNKNLSYIYILHIYIIHVPFNRIHLVSLNQHQKIIARSVLVTKKKKKRREKIVQYLADSNFPIKMQ